jgi:hypothetical protein
VKSTRETQVRCSAPNVWLMQAQPLLPPEINHFTITLQHQEDGRREELAGRLDFPGRPGGLKKPVAQQPEKDMFRNAPER